MRNQFFNIGIDGNTGLITSIVNPLDPHGMNFVSEDRAFGTPNNKSRTYGEPLVLLQLEENDERSVAVYQNGRCRVTVSRYFAENGNFVMRYTVKNLTHTVFCISRDGFGIEIPFNDKYTFADECMTNRCHTHIWCGYNSSWVNALRMGESALNLGMVLTEGSLVSYSQYGAKSNVRGYFELEPETVLLKSGEEYTLAWEFFWHGGNRDFFARLQEYNSQIRVSAPHYTVFMGESIALTVSASRAGTPRVLLGERELAVTAFDGGYRLIYAPTKLGKHRFTVIWGDVRTYAEFTVKPPFAELVRRRIEFIVEHQQCLDKESPLYGAYLVYDNKLGAQYFDYFNSDHNACRERMNMAFVIIRYLCIHPDKWIRESLDLFIDFLFREFYEEQTGEVYNNIGKNHDFLRLYNAPGVMLLFAEMYYLTREERYIDNIVRLADKYYSIGGERCYSNAVAIKKVMGAFALSKRTEDGERVLGYFRRHVDHMISNGLSYPKHEVNYEQTIVTPAVLCISELGAHTSDRERYIAEARKHLACLERFSGHQPDCHLNEIAIRFWDDYWFGQARRFGDTLPHHLSCLTARAFVAFAELSGEREYIERAGECIRNCLSLIGDDGHGSAAYVYPHTVNGADGEFFDGWANDQDLSLYDGMYISQYLPEFSIEQG